MTVRRTPKGKAKELELETRREKVLECKLRGWSVRQIAAHLGIDKSAVQRDLTEVLERTIANADEYANQERECSLARIDGAIKALAPRIERGESDAIHCLVRLEDRRAKLLGLDAPAKQELSGPGGAPVSIDARTDILQRLAGLAASGTPGG